VLAGAVQGKSSHAACRRKRTGLLEQITLAGSLLVVFHHSTPLTVDRFDRPSLLRHGLNMPWARKRGAPVHATTLREASAAWADPVRQNNRAKRKKRCKPNKRGPVCFQARQMLWKPNSCKHVYVGCQELPRCQAFRWAPSCFEHVIRFLILLCEVSFDTAWQRCSVSTAGRLNQPESLQGLESLESVGQWLDRASPRKLRNSRNAPQNL